MTDEGAEAAKKALSRLAGDLDVNAVRWESLTPRHENYLRAARICREAARYVWRCHNSCHTEASMNG